jgi:hypothetical protein
MTKKDDRKEKPMGQALQPTLDIPFATNKRRAERAQVRLSARVQSYSRFMLESIGSDEEEITDVTVKDLSLDGLATDAVGGLRVGSIVRLQIPLVGWRNAEVRWIRGGHAGCRFLVPLAQDELRAAIVSNPLINANFPGLVPHIDRADADPLGLVPRAVPDAPAVELVRLPRLPSLQRDSDWPSPTVFGISVAVALAVWAILYALVA